MVVMNVKLLSFWLALAWFFTCLFRITLGGRFTAAARLFAMNWVGFWFVIDHTLTVLSLAKLAT